MPPRFIPDENVIILAQKRENDRGERDLTCFYLLNRIISICHPIVVDPVLWRKYERQLGRLPARATTSPHLAGILKSPTLPAGKIERYPDDAPPFPEESNIRQRSQDDVPVVVRLAVATRATLVTTDTRLIADLQDSGIAEKYGLQVVPPEAALNLL